MKLLHLLFVIPILLSSCAEKSHQQMENKLLEQQLQETKNLFLQRLKGDERCYIPGYDKMQVIDTQVENLIANMGTVNDLDAIKKQLQVCDDAVLSVNWYSDSMQNQIHEEIAYLMENIGAFDSTSLKSRLQFIQLTYWNFFSNINVRYQYSADTIGTYPVKREGFTGEPFSTPIAAIAYYTPGNYSVIVGDSLVNGFLVGNVRKLTLQEEHMPVYVDSAPIKGHHMIPAKMAAMTLRGEMDTMNFYIEYNIR